MHAFESEAPFSPKWEFKTNGSSKVDEDTKRYRKISMVRERILLSGLALTSSEQVYEDILDSPDSLR